MRVQVVLCKRDENRKIRKRMWDVKVGKKGGEIWVGWQFFSRFLAVSLGSWMGSLGGKKCEPASKVMFTLKGCSLCNIVISIGFYTYVVLTLICLMFMLCFMSLLFAFCGAKWDVWVGAFSFLNFKWTTISGESYLRVRFFSFFLVEVEHCACFE